MRVADALFGLGTYAATRFLDGAFAMRDIILPRPACGERIEVRGFVNCFLQDELPGKINRCGLRSIAAKEGD